MRKLLLSTTLSVIATAALAQVGASSSVYLLDVDPARYAGPESQRLAVVLNDAPRLIVLGAQDEICVQLHSDDPTNPNARIDARVRVIKPQPQQAMKVSVHAPDISPGTYRTTQSGVLVRLVAERAQQAGAASLSTPVGLANAPVCSLDDGGPPLPTQAVRSVAATPTAPTVPAK
jgi:hypothetical protein